MAPESICDSIVVSDNVMSLYENHVDCPRQRPRSVRQCIDEMHRLWFSDPGFAEAIEVQADCSTSCTNPASVWEQSLSGK